jgi:hypothetical protein
VRAFVFAGAVTCVEIDQLQSPPTACAVTQGFPYSGASAFP